MFNNYYCREGLHLFCEENIHYETWQGSISDTPGNCSCYCHSTYRSGRNPQRITDRYGNEINGPAWGSTVAYNYSGEVAIGQVIEIKETNKYGKRGMLIKIIERRTGVTSRVTRPHNLVVI